MNFIKCYFFLSLPASVADYTPSQLFSALDLNYDGKITPAELREAILNMDNLIKIDKDVCSCFRCDGTQYIGAEVCDVYDNSGCSHFSRPWGACYTTNIKKCECNLYSNNPYLCKIPLTYSFVDFTEKKMNYFETNTVKLNKFAVNEDFLERSESAYQKGRNSAFNDVVDIATTYVIADTLGGIMMDALIGKDPF